MGPSQKIDSPSQTFSADKVDKAILLTFGDLKIDPEVKTIDVVLPCLAYAHPHVV